MRIGRLHIPLPARKETTAWALVALAAHTAWGSYPVLARYLQRVSGLPSLSILFFGNLLLLGPLLAYTLRQHGRAFLSNRLLWTFSLVVVLRAITNLLAVRYTLAVYVQLITLMTPLVVVALSALLLKERAPQGTGPALALSLTGAALTLGGNLSQGSFASLSADDWLGLTLASASTLFLALYMILVRRSAHRRVPGDALLTTQVMAVVLTSGAASLLLGEDLGRWLALRTSDWLVFVAYTGGVLAGANVGQIAAIRRLGAPTVSSLLPWRLVSTLAFAALLLGERLTSPLQIGGALLVLGSLSWYLWRTARAVPAPAVGEF